MSNEDFREVLEDERQSNITDFVDLQSSYETDYSEIKTEVDGDDD